MMAKARAAIGALSLESPVPCRVAVFQRRAAFDGDV
jgi:hypothetical protein